MALRIVPAMINNTTLMHINRNMRNLDTIIRQLETTKKVSRPSDDPLIASRALKFRAGADEVRQFQRNVEFGIAWMDVTESAFINVLDNQLQEIRSLLVGGATGTYDISNKATMIEQISALADHIATMEMNQTYAGRYVFSGFRTDEQPVFTAANDRRFMITQHFTLSDIDRTASFQRIGPHADTDPPVAHKVNVLKLAYANLDTDNGDTIINVPGFEVITKSISKDEDAYLPPPPAAGAPPVIHLIAETGELVMHNDVAADFPREGVSVTYSKTGFGRGEINPAVYFTSREIVTENYPVDADRVYQVTQNFSRMDGRLIDSGGQNVYEFLLPYSADFTDPNNAPPNLLPVLPPGATIVNTGGQSFVRIPESVFEHNQHVSVSYSVSIPQASVPASPAPHPAFLLKTDPLVQGVKLIRASLPGSNPLIPIPLDQAESNRSFDMNDQIMTIEAASHTHVGINSLAKDVFTPQMFADFKRLVAFSNSIVISDETELRRRLMSDGYTEPMLSEVVDTQLAKEHAIANDALFTHFNNMLFLIDRHIDQVTREHTQMGARMQRLEMLYARLEADEVSYERLTSDNEDTDMYRALMMRINAQTAFEASLRANSGIIQMTLANFIS